MIRRRTALLAATLLGASGAGAAARSLLPPSSPAAARAAPREPDESCPAFGPGFRRIPGSDTCVKLGGAVRAEFGVNSSGGSFFPDARR